MCMTKNSVNELEYNINVTFTLVTDILNKIAVYTK